MSSRDNLFSSLARSFTPSVFSQWFAKDTADDSHTGTSGSNSDNIIASSSSGVHIQRWSINRESSAEVNHKSATSNQVTTSELSRNLNGKRQLEEDESGDVAATAATRGVETRMFGSTTNAHSSLQQPAAKRARPALNWNSDFTYPNVTNNDNVFQSSVVDQNRSEFGNRYPRRPPSAASSTTSSQRSVSTVPRRASLNIRAGSLSSQTKRILDQLDQMSSPLKDVRKSWLARAPDAIDDADTVKTGLSARLRGRLQGPPLSALSSPSRATVLPRIVGLSTAAKSSRLTPYLMSTRTMSQAGSDSERVQNEEGDRMGGGKMRRTKNLSARTAFLDDAQESPLPCTSIGFALPSGSGPPAGFLSGNTQGQDAPTFAFSPPIPLDTSAQNDIVSTAMVLPSPIAAVESKRSGVDSDKKLPKWSCTECFVSNDAALDKCVCCGASKAGKAGGAFTPTAFGSAAGAAVSSFKPPATAADATKPAKWTCTQCFVPNEANCEKCACCGTNKDGKCIAASSAAFTPSVFATSQSSLKRAISAKWTCGSCCVANEHSAQSCVCCAAPKGGSDKKTAAFANKFEEKTVEKPDMKDWSCTTCFVSNSASKTSCAACSSAKPGTKFKPVSFGIAKGLSTPVSTSAPSTSAIIASTIMSTSSTLFGLKQSTTNTIASFGLKDSSAPTTTKQTISLVRPTFATSSTTEKSTEPEKSTAAGPIFGLSNTSASATAAAATSTGVPAPLYGINAPAADSLATEPVIFGSKAPATDGKPAAAPIFGAGAVASTSGHTPAGPTFGLNTNSVANCVPATPTFAFGGKTTAPSTTTPSFGFGQPSAAASTATTTATFAFGFNKPSDGMQNTAAVAPFTANKTDSAFSAPTAPSALPAPTQSLFAASTAALAQKRPHAPSTAAPTGFSNLQKRSASFLDADANAPKAAPTFAFGKQDQAPSQNAPAAPFKFGASAAPSANGPATGFAFGTAAPAAAANGPSSGFNFGSSATNIAATLSNAPALTNGSTSVDNAFQFQAPTAGFTLDTFKQAATPADKGLFQFGNSISSPNLQSQTAAQPANNQFQLQPSLAANPFQAAAAGRPFLRGKRRGKR